MIKLENISVQDLIYLYNGMKKGRAQDKVIIEFLEKYNIRTYKELDELLKSKNFELDDLEALNCLNFSLSVAKVRVDIANQEGGYPEIYTFDTQRQFGIDEETTKKTDISNKTNVLPYAMPFSYGVLNNYLKNISIDEAKRRLSHYYIAPYGRLKNAFTNRRTIGNEKARKIAELMSFYDEQVVRQSLANPNVRDCNLFTIDLEPRIEIVGSQLKDITEYLFETGDEYVFGKNTPTTKTKIYQASSRPRSDDSFRTRERLIEMLANYCTLEELEKGILIEQETPVVADDRLIKTKSKPIDRFITKRR